MTRRLRVLHVLIQPVLVWDDGETLTPGPLADPTPLLLPDLDGAAARIAADVAAYVEPEQAHSP